jgi:hypothetical protein
MGSVVIIGYLLPEEVPMSIDTNHGNALIGGGIRATQALRMASLPQGADISPDDVLLVVGNLCRQISALHLENSRLIDWCEELEKRLPPSSSEVRDG